MRTQVLGYILLTLMNGGLPSTGIPPTLQLIEPTPTNNINTPENFPDPHFRRVVEEMMGVGPGRPFTAEQAAQVQEISCSGWSIRDLSDLQYFIGLEKLDCSSCLLPALDLSGNPALSRLNCADNQLAVLDLFHNPALEGLHCANNHLTALDLSHNRALKSLSCNDNKLNALDLSGNPKLTWVWCSDIRLTDLSGLLAKPGWKQGDTLDITNNDLDVGDCADIHTLLTLIGPPRQGDYRGFRYSPQNGGPLNCALADVAGWAGY